VDLTLRNLAKSQEQIRTDLVDVVVVTTNPQNDASKTNETINHYCVTR